MQNVSNVSIKEIAEMLNIEEKQAEKVKELCTIFDVIGIGNVIKEINDITNCYGIENITCEEHWQHYWLSTCAIYCNSGDPYNTTVLYCSIQNEWFICCYGDYVEKYQEEYGIN